MSLGNKTLCDLCNSKAYRKQKAKKDVDVSSDGMAEGAEDPEDSEDMLNDPNPSIVTLLVDPITSSEPCRLDQHFKMNKLRTLPLYVNIHVCT